MATRKTTTKSTATKATTPKDTTPKTTSKPVETAVETNDVVEEVVEAKKEPRRYAQNDYILCRSVTPGGLIINGRSGQKYFFSNVGDEAEIEFQDLFSLKNSHSGFLYKPRIIIEDEELLENPRWQDLAKFYEEEVYGMEDVEEIIEMPISQFKAALERLPKGLMRQLQLVVSQRMEEGTFDSLTKLKAMDEYCGTDFMKMLPR